MLTQPTVFVVDDDPQVRESLQLLLGSIGLAVKAYGTAEEFLDEYTDEPGPPRCLVLDVRMPGLSGVGLQERLNSKGIKVPVIVITGYANVPLAVQAMSNGAIDFIEKPFSRQTLLTRVQEAIDRDAQQRQHLARRAEVATRMATLSQREREVMGLLVSGNNSKHIASKLEISEKTVAKHRAKVFQKMQVDSVAALVSMSVQD